MTEASVRSRISRPRVAFGLSATMVGLALYLLGVDPGMFGLDRSPVLGFVQISVFLLGLALICLGGYTTINAFWSGTEKSILADIGFRLVSTGYMICAASGLADILGFGNQPLPGAPYFGPLQALGVTIGEGIIAIGFLLMTPFSRLRRKALKKEPDG